jgi:ubiquitin-protein ligase
MASQVPISNRASVDADGFEEWDGDDSAQKLMTNSVTAGLQNITVANDAKRVAWERRFTSPAAQRLLAELFSTKHEWSSEGDTPFAVQFVLKTSRIQGIVVQLTFQQSYPFFPPEMEVIRPYFGGLSIKLSVLRMLQLRFWNPTRSIEYIIGTLLQILEKHATIVEKGEMPMEVSEFQRAIMQFNARSDATSIIDDVDPNRYTAVSIPHSGEATATAESQKTTASSHLNGVGYGTEASSQWNIERWEAAKREKSQRLQETIITMKRLAEPSYKIACKITVDIVETCCTLRALCSILREAEVMDMSGASAAKWCAIIELIELMVFNSNANSEKKLSRTQIESAVEIYRVIFPMISVVSVLKEVKLTKSLKTLRRLLISMIKEEQLDQIEQRITGDSYVDTMFKHQWRNWDIIDKKDSFYLQKSDVTTTYSNSKRIMAEICNLENNLPLSRYAPLLCRFDETNMGYFKFAVFGPPDTPYSAGIFLFDVALPQNYPYPQSGESPIRVILMTTGRGKVRFNPNLYSDGKVCLSLLGTYPGHPSENWRPEGSTILQLMVSIQSTVMNPQPYFNEPGYNEGSERHVEAAKKFNNGIRLETMRWAMIDHLKNPHPAFADAIKFHFRKRRSEILEQCQLWVSEALEETKIAYEKEFSTLKSLLERL